MLDIRRLRLLRELSIRGTLIEVAEELNYSPSSVSQQLSALEKEAGVQLLRRVGRQVQLTPQAHVLVAHTEELLASLELTEAALAASQTEVTGTVRVAVFQTATLALMPGALRRLRLNYPEVRVIMFQHEPETALRDTWAREFDLVVAEQYPGHAARHHPGLDRRPLLRDVIRLAVPGNPDSPEEFFRVDRLEDTAHLPWVMEPRGSAVRHWATQACRIAGFEPEIRYESADLQAQVRLVESGNAVALLPDLIWTQRDTTARLLDLQELPRREVFTSIRDSTASHPAVAAVRAALEEEASLLSSDADIISNM
ncbi:LysR substrate-binding domain-containing protein [Zhihengliuella salsuginis]|uniref:LysR family transcriptional regulator n=1 Tax=Zhihengliuella salsuginis TaxID=578222 RepID=A0ABQ3GHS7_9MICC|nr:LysR substrate-binding domain-containing protein [Zhihengliuella salsuginis]GHD06579.1 LysR family transcriptional regulator [Zhihengliuella salsuginis]